MKSLVIYFSRADENIFGGAYRYTEKGNTEIIAERISALTGADLFKCESVKPYPKEYEECIEVAKRELESDARPQIKPFDKNLADYDLIYICYPIYWGALPRPMCTLLEGLDFTGKTIKPLCTHEGGGLGGTVREIKKICKGAKVEKGLAIIGGKVSESEALLSGWIIK